MGFLGNLIIAYSIEAAIQTELFDEVMVSTDDKAIVAISKGYGAESLIPAIIYQEMNSTCFFRLQYSAREIDETVRSAYMTQVIDVKIAIARE